MKQEYGNPGLVSGFTVNLTSLVTRRYSEYIIVSIYKKNSKLNISKIIRKIK